MPARERLCETRDPEWWEFGDDGNRLALVLCRICVGCPDNDPNPCAIIRGGVAYGEDFKPRALCRCGYPVEAPAPKRPDVAQQCRRCQLPTMDRYQESIIRWRQRGDSYAAIGRRIAFSPDNVSKKYREWTRDGEAVPA